MSAEMSSEGEASMPSPVATDRDTSTSQPDRPAMERDTYTSQSESLDPPVHCPSIARSDPYKDVTLFCEDLWVNQTQFCWTIWDDEIPRPAGAPKRTEQATDDEYISRYFDEEARQTHGGQFLKSVLVSIANYNHYHIDKVANEWVFENVSLFQDVGTAKQLREAIDYRRVFNRPFCEYYSNYAPLLQRVMQWIQRNFDYFKRKAVPESAGLEVDKQNMFIASAPDPTHSLSEQGLQPSPERSLDAPPHLLADSTVQRVGPRYAASSESQSSDLTQQPKRSGGRPSDFSTSGITEHQGDVRVDSRANVRIPTQAHQTAVHLAASPVLAPPFVPQYQPGTYQHHGMSYIQPYPNQGLPVGGVYYRNNITGSVPHETPRENARGRGGRGGNYRGRGRGSSFQASQQPVMDPHSFHRYPTDHSQDYVHMQRNRSSSLVSAERSNNWREKENVQQNTDNRRIFSDQGTTGAQWKADEPPVNTAYWSSAGQESVSGGPRNKTRYSYPSNGSQEVFVSGFPEDAGPDVVLQAVEQLQSCRFHTLSGGNLYILIQFPNREAAQFLVEHQPLCLVGGRQLQFSMSPPVPTGPPMATVINIPRSQQSYGQDQGRAWQDRRDGNHVNTRYTPYEPQDARVLPAPGPAFSQGHRYEISGGVGQEPGPYHRPWDLDVAMAQQYAMSGQEHGMVPTPGSFLTNPFPDTPPDNRKRKTPKKKGSKKILTQAMIPYSSEPAAGSPDATPDPPSEVVMAVEESTGHSSEQMDAASPKLVYDVPDPRLTQFLHPSESAHSLPPSSRSLPTVEVGMPTALVEVSENDAITGAEDSPEAVSNGLDDLATPTKRVTSLARDTDNGEDFDDSFRTAAESPAPDQNTDTPDSHDGAGDADEVVSDSKADVQSTRPEQPERGEAVQEHDNNSCKDELIIEDTAQTNAATPLRTPKQTRPKPAPSSGPAKTESLSPFSKQMRRQKKEKTKADKGKIVQKAETHDVMQTSENISDIPIDRDLVGSGIEVAEDEVDTSVDCIGKFDDQETLSTHTIFQTSQACTTNTTETLLTTSSSRRKSFELLVSSRADPPSTYAPLSPASTGTIGAISREASPKSIMDISKTRDGKSGQSTIFERADVLLSFATDGQVLNTEQDTEDQDAAKVKSKRKKNKKKKKAQKDVDAGEGSSAPQSTNPEEVQDSSNDETEAIVTPAASNTTSPEVTMGKCRDSSSGVLTAPKNSLQARKKKSRAGKTPTEPDPVSSIFARRREVDETIEKKKKQLRELECEVNGTTPTEPGSGSSACVEKKDDPDASKNQVTYTSLSGLRNLTAPSRNAGEPILSPFQESPEIAKSKHKFEEMAHKERLTKLRKDGKVDAASNEEQRWKETVEAFDRTKLSTQEGPSDESAIRNDSVTQTFDMSTLAVGTRVDALKDSYYRKKHMAFAPIIDGAKVRYFIDADPNKTCAARNIPIPSNLDRSDNLPSLPSRFHYICERMDTLGGNQVTDPDELALKDYMERNAGPSR